jgi:ribosome production factor 1
MAIKNKQVRKLQHIKRKRTENAAKHKLRHDRRKEETKDPSLRAERLARSVPLTLDVSLSIEDSSPCIRRALIICPEKTNMG